MIIQSTQVARSTPFDNDTNGFVSENVQAAIEENRNVVVEDVIVGVNFEDFLFDRDVFCRGFNH